MSILRNTALLRTVVSLPLIVMGGAAALSFGVAWLALSTAALLLILETPGKMLTLLVSGGLWVAGFALAGAGFPGWGVIVVVILGTALVSLPVWRIGQDWGNRRYAMMAHKGRPMREWEWVYVGREFARAHPFYRLSFGTGMIALVLVSVPAFYWTTWIVRQDVFSAVFLGFATSFYLLTLFCVFRRWPVAYPLVFLGLLPGLPFTFPFFFYWADGVRPNLIYRHRFERLVPEE